MNILFFFRVAGLAISVWSKSMIAACRAMIARQICRGNDDLAQGFAGSAGKAGGGKGSGTDPPLLWRYFFIGEEWCPALGSRVAEI
jgi:hypothetical protein